MLLKNKSISTQLVFTFMLIIPFWYGLFYEYSAMFAGAVLTIILAVILIQKKQFIWRKSLHFYLYAFLIFSYLLATLWAVDKGQALDGFLKFLPALIFFVILMQLDKQEIKDLFISIPYSGIAMCLLAYVLRFIPFIDPILFSENGRLVGFFQYSNTFALYLLIGLIVLWDKQEKSIKDYLGIIVLFSGIILSGSRIVFVLLILFGIYQIIKKRKNKKGILISIGISIAVLLAIALLLQLLGQFQVITRLFSISFTESTFLGRIIYNLDGIMLLLQHPFGLGYGGYEWIYPSIQTADYDIKFVHNDILQQGLDTGIIPMIVLLFLLIHTLINKKTTRLAKEITCVLLFHLFFDFDLQFTIMHFILVMLIFEEDAKIIRHKLQSKVLVTATLVIILSVFLYFGIANMAMQKGNTDLAENMLSYKTKIAKLGEITNMQEANKQADEILKSNPYVAVAYHIKAENALYEENWEDMIKYKKQAIELEPYEILGYEEYVLLISQALDKTIKQKENKWSQKLITHLSEVEELLEKVKQKTNPLAYEIADKPNLELSQEITQYLLNFKEEEKDVKN